MAVHGGGCGKVSRDASDDSQMGISLQIPRFIRDVPSIFFKCSSIGPLASTFHRSYPFPFFFPLSFSMIHWSHLEPFGSLKGQGATTMRRPARGLPWRDGSGESMGRCRSDPVGMFLLCFDIFVLICYESQPVGLAEVISASEASLGGPGGRASQMYKNRVK